MKNKSKLLTGAILMITSFLGASDTHAQKFGISGNINHMSNGINLFYAPAMNRNWNAEAGLRIMVNTYAINDNKQNHISYQTGYAHTFPEHFSLNFRLSRKLVAYQWIRLEWMMNLHLTHHGFLRKFSGTVPDPITGVPKPNISSERAEPAMELTTGPLIRVSLSGKTALFGTVGYGAVYMYRYRILVKPEDMPAYLSGEPSNIPGRGSYEMVGFDRLPMISVGATYKIN